MHYFYIKEEFGRGTFNIYSSPRNPEYKTTAWPYEAMYCDQGSWFHDKLQWLEENSKMFVISKVTTHFGGRIFGASYEIYIDDMDEAIQFKLTFCDQ